MLKKLLLFVHFLGDVKPIKEIDKLWQKNW